MLRSPSPSETEGVNFGTSLPEHNGVWPSCGYVGTSSPSFREPTLWGISEYSDPSPARTSFSTFRLLCISGRGGTWPWVHPPLDSRRLESWRPDDLRPLPTKGLGPSVRLGVFCASRFSHDTPVPKHLWPVPRSPGRRPSESLGHDVGPRERHESRGGPLLVSPASD